MKLIRVFLIGCFYVSLVYWLATLWDMKAAPFAYPGQAALLFLLVGIISSAYFIVFGISGYLVLCHFNKLNTRAFILCGLICALPMIALTINSGEIEYVLASIIAGPTSGYFAATQLLDTNVKLANKEIQ